MQSIGFGDKSGLARLLTDLIAEKLQVERNLVNIHLLDMPASTVAIGGNCWVKFINKETPKMCLSQT